MLAFAGAATALITTTAAIAADFPAAPPPQTVTEPGGWYRHWQPAFQIIRLHANRGQSLAGNLAHRPEGHQGYVLLCGRYRLCLEQLAPVRHHR